MANPDFGMQPQPYAEPVQPPRPTSGVAIAALVLAITVSPVGLILAYVARSRIKKTGEEGWALTTAALIIGWIGTVPLAILALVGIWIAMAMLYHELPIFDPLLSGWRDAPRQYIGATIYTLALVGLVAFLARRFSKSR